MSNTEEKKNHPLHLISDSTISTQSTYTNNLYNEERDFVVQIIEQKTLKSSPGRNAKLMAELWNEYHALPFEYKYSPKVLFQSMQVNDKLLESRGEAIIKLSESLESNANGINSDRWWNRVYRWSLLIILIGLIAYAVGR